MNASWDTPEYSARSEADDVVRDMPEVARDQRAASLEASAPHADRPPERVMLIVADLRRRAGAGLRFWPATEPSAASDGHLSDTALSDDDIPW